MRTKNNKSEFVKVNIYGSIASNKIYANIFYIVKIKYFLCTIQEDMESCGNYITYVDIICGAIYTYHG